jgi:hypothetical protein
MLLDITYCTYYTAHYAQMKVTFWSAAIALRSYINKGGACNFQIKILDIYTLSLSYKKTNKKAASTRTFSYDSDYTASKEK